MDTSLRALIDRIAARPFLLILAIAMAKIAVMFLLIPLVEVLLRGNYGTEFADNYDLLARTISRGHGYRFTADTAPTLMREPGFPLFLAAVFKTFGYGLDVVRVLNVAMSSLTAWMLYRFVRGLDTRPWVAAAAAVIFLANPGIFVVELRGGVESPFILLLVLFLWRLQVAFDTGALRDYLIAGACLGLTTLVRGTAVLFPVFVCGLACIGLLLHRKPIFRQVVSIGSLLCVTAVVMSPWILRNYLASGAIVPTSSVPAIAAHSGLYACAHRDWKAGNFSHVDFEGSRARRDFAQDLGLRFRDGGYYLYFYATKDELRFNSELARYVRNAYTADPALFVRCAALNVVNFWFQGKNWPTTLANVVAQLPFLVLALVGIFQLVRNGDWRRAWVWAAFIPYLMCVHIPILALARYSIALVPVLAVLGAVGLGYLLTRSGAGAGRPTSAMRNAMISAASGSSQATRA